MTNDEFDDWLVESQLRWHADINRGEARAEVNKLLAAVLENEPKLLRRLLVFSVLVERATALRDQTLDEYIQEQGLVVQPHILTDVAKLAGLSAQTVRNREKKIRIKEWEHKQSEERERDNNCSGTGEGE
jgi:hypothetical protein